MAAIHIHTSSQQGEKVLRGTDASLWCRSAEIMSRAISPAKEWQPQRLQVAWGGVHAVPDRQHHHRQQQQQQQNHRAPPPWEPAQYSRTAHAFVPEGFNVHPPKASERPALSLLQLPNGATPLVPPPMDPDNDAARIQASLNLLDTQRLRLADALQKAKSAQASRLSACLAPTEAVPQIPSLVGRGPATPAAHMPHTPHTPHTSHALPGQRAPSMTGSSPIRSGTQPQELARPVMSPSRPKGSRQGQQQQQQQQVVPGGELSPEKIRKQLLPDPQRMFVLKAGTAEETARAAAAAAEASRRVGSIEELLTHAREEEARKHSSYRESMQRGESRVGSVWNRLTSQELGAPAPVVALPPRSGSPGAQWNFDAPDRRVPGGTFSDTAHPFQQAPPQPPPQLPPGNFTQAPQQQPQQQHQHLQQPRSQPGGQELPPGVRAAQNAGVLPRLSSPVHHQSAATDETSLPPGDSGVHLLRTGTADTPRMGAASPGWGLPQGFPVPPPPPPPLPSMVPRPPAHLPPPLYNSPPVPLVSSPSHGLPPGNFDAAPPAGVLYHGASGAPPANYSIAERHTLPPGNAVSSYPLSQGRVPGDLRAAPTESAGLPPGNHDRRVGPVYHSTSDLVF